MEEGELYQWKKEWHKTFQHILVGAEDHEKSYIQTIWIDPESLTGECVLPTINPPTINPQGGYGIRTDNFQYQTNRMVFLRCVNLEDHGFDFHGYNSPVPETSKTSIEEMFQELGTEHKRDDDAAQFSFVSYYWFEFLLFDIDGENCKVCSWIFLESNDRGIPYSQSKIFYKYFEKVK